MMGISDHYQDPIEPTPRGHWPNVPKAMTTPTNSDRLRETLMDALCRHYDDSQDTEHLHRLLDTVLMPHINEEINKLNAEKAETIEALEHLQKRLGRYPSLYGRDTQKWFEVTGQPLLDKLKGSPGQTKEGL